MVFFNPLLGSSLLLAGAGLFAQSLRTRHFLRREARALLARGDLGAPRALDRSRFEALPLPARTHLERALAGASTAFENVRFRHGGRFRARLDGPWAPIRGEQYVRAAPPAFLWLGRLRLAPLLWMQACDRSVDGVGSMTVRLESTIPVIDRRGAEIDQGALLRLLGELVLLPSALVDGRYVRWSAIDDTHVKATLSLGPEGVSGEVSGTFELGKDGLFSRFSAERYRDDGRGRAVLAPWSGDYAEYREVRGVLVPQRLIAHWHDGAERMPVADFELEPLELDVREPY